MQKPIGGAAGIAPGISGLASAGGGALSGQYRSLTQIIVEMLRERIFAGEYSPGARLNIADLAQSFEVSPVPVREALRNLETEGLVQFHPNRGVTVRELSVDEVRELYMIRIRLEALAGAEAGRWAKSDDIVALAALLASMDETDDVAEWDLLHTRFHDVFYRLARMPRLYHLVMTLRGQMRPYSRLYLANPEHNKKARAEHYSLVDALRSRDRDEIERIIHEHLTRPARIAMIGISGDPDASVEDFAVAE